MIIIANRDYLLRVKTIIIISSVPMPKGQRYFIELDCVGTIHNFVFLFFARAIDCHSLHAC